MPALQSPDPSRTTELVSRQNAGLPSGGGAGGNRSFLCDPCCCVWARRCRRARRQFPLAAAACSVPVPSALPTAGRAELPQASLWAQTAPKGAWLGENSETRRRAAQGNCVKGLRQQTLPRFCLQEPRRAPCAATATQTRAVACRTNCASASRRASAPQLSQATAGGNLAPPTSLDIARASRQTAFATGGLGGVRE